MNCRASFAVLVALSWLTPIHGWAGSLDPAIWKAPRIAVVKPEVSVPPQLVKSPAPIFPNVHHQPHYLVELNATVGLDGKLHDIVPTKSEDEIFLQAAKEAIVQWVFQPAQKDGKPVACQIYLSIPFKKVTRELEPNRFPQAGSP